MVITEEKTIRNVRKLNQSYEEINENELRLIN